MKIKKLFTLMLFPLLLVGCNKPQEPVETRGTVTESADGLSFTIVDMQYRDVTITKAKRERVICLGAGALRYYSYIGDLDKLVAIENIDKEPFTIGTRLRPYYEANKEKFATLSICGQGGPMNQAPNYELLPTFNPDIIVSFYSSAEVNNEMSTRLNVPVLALKQGIQGVFDKETLLSFEILGKVFDKQNRATELINYINSAKAELSALPRSNEKYYAGCIGNWGKTPFYGSFKNFPVFDFANVVNSIDQFTDLAKNTQVTIDAEKMITANPDKIFIDTAGLEAFKTEYQANPTVFNALKAFQQGELYLLLPYNAYYTNIEIQLMSTYYVASIAHQSNFASFNLENKCNEILQKFVGKAMYDECKTHPNGFGGYRKITVGELAE